MKTFINEEDNVCMMSTSIRISKQNKARLVKLKRGYDSFNSVIGRLIPRAERELGINDEVSRDELVHYLVNRYGIYGAVDEMLERTMESIKKEIKNG